MKKTIYSFLFGIFLISTAPYSYGACTEAELENYMYDKLTKSVERPEPTVLESAQIIINELQNKLDNSTSESEQNQLKQEIKLTRALAVQKYAPIQKNSFVKFGRTQASVEAGACAETLIKETEENMKKTHQGYAAATKNELSKRIETGKKEITSKSPIKAIVESKKQEKELAAAQEVANQYSAQASKAKKKVEEEVDNVIKYQGAVNKVLEKPILRMDSQEEEELSKELALLNEEKTNDNGSQRSLSARSLKSTGSSRSNREFDDALLAEEFDDAKSLSGRRSASIDSDSATLKAAVTTCTQAFGATANLSPSKLCESSGKVSKPRALASKNSASDSKSENKPKLLIDSLKEEVKNHQINLGLEEKYVSLIEKDAKRKDKTERWRDTTNHYLKKANTAYNNLRKPNLTNNQKKLYFNELKNYLELAKKLNAARSELNADLR